MGYNAPYSYGGYTYNRKDALQVKGPYYTSVNAGSQSGSFSSNTTKYFYGYYTNDDGSSVKHPLGLMNYQSQNSLTFGFMDMSAIQSGGTANTYTMTMYHRKYNPNTGNWDHFKTTTASAKYGTVFTPPYSETPSGHYNYSRDWNGGWTVSGNGSFYVNYHPNSYTMTSYHHKWNPVSSQWVHYSTTTASALYGTTYTPPWQTPSYHYNYSRDWDGGWTVSGNGGFSLYYYPNSYSLDVNGRLDGTILGNTSGFGTFDVYVNGTAVADNVSDYYDSHPYGSTWEVKDVKALTGYTYNGWYSGGMSGTITGNVASVQDFSTTSSTLTVIPNWGTWNGSIDNQSFTQNSGTTKNIPVPTRDGYHFIGWSEAGGGSIDIAGEYSDVSGPHSIAVYNNTGNGNVTHTQITDSSAPVGSVVKRIDVKGTASPGWGGFYDWTQSVSGGVFIHTFVAKVPVGYTLNIASNACGDGYTQTWLTDHVGTGDWEVYSYRTNCGTTGTFSSFGYVYVTGGSAPFSWYVNSSQVYKVSGNTFTFGDSASTLKALWVPQKYTLTVNPNGGTWNGSTSTQSFRQAYGTTKDLPLPTRDGYRFVGWQDLGSGWTYDSNNDNICFENGVGNISTYCNANDGSVSITREAMSTPTGSGYGLKIHFNSSAQTNWGWGFVDSEQSEANATFIHAFQAKIPKGYTLQYAYNACGDGATRRWLTSNEGTGDWATYAYETKCGSTGSFGTFGYVYLTGGSVPVTWYLASSNIYKSTGSTFYYSSGNGSLKAIWAPNRYTITYNANGGYSTPNTTSTSQVITYDETFSFKNREYTKPGYVHIGWNTKADGSGTKYAIGLSTTYTTAGDLTVYAQWRAATAEEQKIYLYNNGHCEALGFAKTSDWYGFKKGVVGAKDFTIGSPATAPSHTMQFKGMIVKNLT